MLPEEVGFAGRQGYWSACFITSTFDLDFLTFRIVSITIFLKLTKIFIKALSKIIYFFNDGYRPCRQYCQL
jgi:hypothetical protein